MKFRLSILLFIFLFSCNKKQEDKNVKNEALPLLSIVKEHVVFEKVNPSFEKEIEKWIELKALENFILRFKKVSANEALSNALELKELVKSLKNTAKPKLFETASFKTRVNILYNETLRLADMTFIPAIKAEEVNKQTDKIIEAFSAINSKINTIYSKKRFEEAIDIDIKYIGLDSTKIDSVSKQTIKKSRMNANLNKKKPVFILPKKRNKKEVLKPKNQQ